MEEKNYINFTINEIQEFDKIFTLLVPVGSIEQHGPHLPCSVDSDIAEAICKKITTITRNCIAAPTIHFTSRSFPQSGGVNNYHGSIYISGNVLINYFEEIIKSFLSVGFKNIVFLNGHYENENFLCEAAEINREKYGCIDSKIIILSWWSLINDNFVHKYLREYFAGWDFEHAGFVETSLMKYLYPDKVRYNNHETDISLNRGIYYSDLRTRGNRLNNGVLSSAEGANAKSGQLIFDEVIKCLKGQIEQL